VGIDLIEHNSIRGTSPLQVDVLLVTVTDIEARAVLDAFPGAKLYHLGDQAYHDLGMRRNARIFMVQSEMGSGGQSGAILTINEAIDVLHPSAIIMVGIAFGRDEKKQQPGDILISRQIQPYDLQKVGTDRYGEMDIALRGDRPSASPKMLSIFRGAANYWPTPPSIHFGLILSGDKLIANQTFRDQLISLSLEAIGGEMEGAGLYAAAQRKKVDWILVKAICDWADGNKNDAHQQLAAENAVRFLVHVLENGGFVASKDQRFQAGVVNDSSHEEAINQTRPESSRSPEDAEKTIEASLVNLQHSSTASQQNALDKSSVNTIHIAAQDPTISIIPIIQHERPSQPHRITRRTLVLFGSAGVGIAALGGIGWLELAQHSSITSSDSIKTPTRPSSQPEPIATETPPETQISAQWDINTIAWSPNGHFIASGSNDSTVLVRNVITDKIIFKKPQPSHVQSVAWSPDGTKIAVGNQDSSLHILDAATGNLITSAGGSPAPIQTSISWSYDSKRIVATEAQIWDATTGKLIYTYSGTETDCPVAWSPDGTKIASGSHSNSALGSYAGVDIWNATTHETICQYINRSQIISPTNAIAWSPNRKFIAVSYTSETVVDVWDTTTTTSEPITHTSQTTSKNVLAWSPDSTKIASLALDGIEIWDTSTGKTITIIQGSSSATCVAWSPDGSEIASGSDINGTIQITQTSLLLASTLIYQTYWSDGDGGWNHTNGWVLQRGIWINSGKGSEGHLTLPESLYSRKTNYSITTTIQFNQFVPSSDGSEFGIMTDMGYTWVIRPSSNGGTESALLDGNGGETKVRTHYVSDLSLITPGTIHTYQVAVKQGIFMCLIDGRLCTDYLLPTNLQQEPIMGLMTKHSNITVSDFQIFSL
jgi:nucleoside phosphorylase/WD40 repeat protein